MAEQQPPEEPHGVPSAGGQSGPAQGWGEQQLPPSQPPPGPPPPGWGQPSGPPPPKRRFGRGVLVGCISAVVLLVGIIIVIVVVVSGGSKTTPTNPTHPPEADVTITSCGVDPTTSIPDAKVEIINHSSKSSNYTIGVEFVDSSGTRLADGAALASNVAPNQKVEEDAGGTAQVTTKITCRLTSVNRFSAVG
ncbi:hypothetical protein P3T35_008070 [Kitasatospora sp. GP30]|nr:hypothetical protein [Kitasatospora sp. GP30]